MGGSPEHGRGVADNLVFLELLLTNKQNRGFSNILPYDVVFSLTSAAQVYCSFDDNNS